MPVLRQLKVISAGSGAVLGAHSLAAQYLGCPSLAVAAQQTRISALSKAERRQVGRQSARSCVR